MLDIRQTSKYARHLKNTGWIVEEKKGFYYFIKKFPIIGSLIKIQRPEIIDNLIIQQLSRKYRAFQITIEPNLTTDYRLLTTEGFNLGKNPFLPTKTLQLDLTKSENELFEGLKKDARSAIKKNKDLGIKIYELDDIEKFRKAWKMAVGLKRYIPSLGSLLSLTKSFGRNSLFITDMNSSSGAIFLLADKTGYYWQAFTGKEGRKMQTQYKIVWEGILWAKKKGARLFDFEGIYDERFPNKSWLGFTHFKKSFGGYEVIYPGCYTKFQLSV